jgi:phosphoesterase RecJ-like protein
MGGSVGMKSALPLYTGMMTDTNNFSNSVLPSTFRMAAGLMDIGVDKEWVQKMVFGGYSENRMRLMGHMLVENMKIIPQYNASVMVLTRAMKERFNFTDGDSEGFVNLALNIKDVKVSGFFTEGEEFIRVSLRSKDDFSVNRLAREFFNGGGHERAAGGRLFMPVDQVEEYFIKSLGNFIGNGSQA